MRQSTFNKTKISHGKSSLNKFKFNNTCTRTCTPTTGYFYEKKNLQGKSSSGLLFTAEHCTRQSTLIFFTWAQSLTKFNSQMQDFKRVLDLNCK